MSTTTCIIATSPGIDTGLVDKIQATLPKSIGVRRQTYFQATAGAFPEVIEIVFIFVSMYVGKGFLEELGKDAYRKLKGELKNIFSRGEERTLSIDFKSKKTKLSFRIETDDDSKVDSALEKIPEIISKTRKSASF